MVEWCEMNWDGWPTVQGRRLETRGFFFLPLLLMTMKWKGACPTVPLCSMDTVVWILSWFTVLVLDHGKRTGFPKQMNQRVYFNPDNSYIDSGGLAGWNMSQDDGYSAKDCLFLSLEWQSIKLANNWLDHWINNWLNLEIKKRGPKAKGKRQKQRWSNLIPRLGKSRQIPPKSVDDDWKISSS